MGHNLKFADIPMSSPTSTNSAHNTVEPSCTTTVQSLRFRFDPYNAVSATVSGDLPPALCVPSPVTDGAQPQFSLIDDASSYYEDSYYTQIADERRRKEEAAAAAAAKAEQRQPTPEPECPPEGTLHTSLWSQVTFVPYPDEEFHPENEHDVPPVDQRNLESGAVVRVFIGQLPYYITDMQLNWLCHTFGSGNIVHYCERIMKRQSNGEKLPTGCIHAFCRPSAVPPMVQGMHKRILIDDTGVWFAQNPCQAQILNSYVSMLKADKSKRFPHRPYDTVVVQTATSSFVSRPQTAVGGLDAEQLPLPTQKSSNNRHHGHQQQPHQPTTGYSNYQGHHSHRSTPMVSPQTQAASRHTESPASAYHVAAASQGSFHSLCPPTYNTATAPNSGETYPAYHTQHNGSAASHGLFPSINNFDETF